MSQSRARRRSLLTPDGKGKEASYPVMGSLESFSQGVSQQPEHLRKSGQGQEQINGWSSPVEGLRKRQPGLFKYRLFNEPADGTEFFVDKFIVQYGEVYYFVVVPYKGKVFAGIYRDGIRVPVAAHGTGITTGVGTGPDGSAQNWLCGTGASYLASAMQAGPITTTNQYVLINNGPIGSLLNRDQIVKMKSDLSPVLGETALLFVQSVNYDITYTLTVDGTKYTYKTPKPSDTNNTLSTTIVVDELTKQLPSAQYTVVKDGAVAAIRRVDGAPMAIKIDDSYANSLARVLYKEVATVGYLPTKAVDGFKIKISSDPKQTVDDRWLVFRSSVPGTGVLEGVWEETIAPSTAYKLDEQTLPLTVYRAANNAFFVGPADGSTKTLTAAGNTYTYTFPAWGERTVGDDKSAPNPDFVGQKIRDHLIFRSRYAVASGSSVVFSEVDDIYNFWPDTTLEVLETDPFSVRAYSETSTELNWLLPVDETMLAFSSDSQFSIRPADADVLTPRSAIILRLSNIEMNASLRPKIAGSNVVFATQEYGHTNLRQYQFFDSTQRRLGLNLGGSLNSSLNTPKYVVGLANHWDVGESLDYLAMITPADLRTIYIYKYLFNVSVNGIQEIQAAWSKWQFSNPVRNLFFNENSLTLFMSNPTDGVYVMEVDAEELQAVESPDILLDRKIHYPECNSNNNNTDDVVASYDSISRKTTFTLPYQVQAKTVAVVRFDHPTLGGFALGSTEIGNKIICEEFGDYTGIPIAFGELYKFQYVLSKLYYPRQRSSTREVVGDLSGRLQVHNITFNHHNTGRYEVIVERENRAPSTYPYRARELSVFNNRLAVSEMPIATDVFRVPVYSKNLDHRIRVESDNWLPVTITSAQWEGTYSNRARRI